MRTLNMIRPDGSNQKSSQVVEKYKSSIQSPQNTQSCTPPDTHHNPPPLPPSIFLKKKKNAVSAADIHTIQTPGPESPPNSSTPFPT